MAQGLGFLRSLLCRSGLILLPFLTHISADSVGDLQSKGRTQINAQLAKSTTCHSPTIRKEWGDISVPERKAYIKAVLCLMERPSKLPAGEFPGATNRYEDFVVFHMQQTLKIHRTGKFLPLHRYYTWVYEQTLKTECNYRGTQPYWDWGKWADNPEASPIFDGSESSMGGNGQKISHKGVGIGPAQNGGGCVQKGPFANMTVHLGPVSPVVDPAPPRNPRADGYGINKRCLRRDIGPYLCKNFATTAIITALINDQKTIGAFQDTMQSTTGVHSAGHLTIGGDPGGDLYTSPNDPAFFLLHAIVDRVWTIWQSQDLPHRMQVMAGGTSMYGPSAPQKLTDIVDLTPLTSKVYQLKDLMSVVDGPFCYVYE
ncbi:related to tyrosinase [Rhynchosporium secalis]|uniref:Related to tyrosinase n=1 Tax=Rhynchosporium secalis TaxID=38038 RepID=A0A1E1LW15_RHYSE|nr:related to tyrosinase [Rhynchosporium secalis]